MKRLVWLLLAVFATALAQVAPVDVGITQEQPCACCEAPGQCGQQDCPLPATRTPSASLVAERPSPARSSVSRRNAARVYRLALNYLLLGREASPEWSFKATRPAAVDRVPLFKAQCSFLI